MKFFNKKTKDDSQNQFFPDPTVTQNDVRDVPVSRSAIKIISGEIKGQKILKIEGLYGETLIDLQEWYEQEVIRTSSIHSSGGFSNFSVNAHGNPLTVYLGEQMDQEVYNELIETQEAELELARLRIQELENGQH